MKNSICLKVSAVVKLVFACLLLLLFASSAQAAPTINVSAPSKSLTNTGPVTYTVTYINAYFYSLDPGMISLVSTGTATAGRIEVSGTGEARTVTLSNISGDGTLAISIAAGSALDADTVPAPAFGPSEAFTVDNSPPSVMIQTDDIPVSRGPSVSFRIIYDSVSSVNLRGSDVIVHTTGSVAYTGINTINSPDLRAVVVTGVSGIGFLSISLKAGTATDGINPAPAAGPSHDVLVDSDLPLVTISEPSAAAARGGAVTYTLTYTGHLEADPGIEDITVNKSGTATHSGVSVSGEGSTFLVTLANVRGQGTMGISVAADTAKDFLGRAPAAGPSQTFIVDDEPPTASFLQNLASVSRGGTVRFRVGYDGHDTIALSKNDVMVVPSAGVSYTKVSIGNLASTRIRFIDIEGVGGEGRIAVALKPGTAHDAIEAVGGLGTSEAVTIDPDAPQVSIGAPLVPLTRNGPVRFILSYSGHDTIKVAERDITVHKTGTANAATVTVSGSGSVRYVDLSEITGDGTLGISVSANTAVDQLGNAPAAGPSLTFKVDNTPPTITLNPMPVLIR